MNPSKRFILGFLCCSGLSFALPLAPQPGSGSGAANWSEVVQVKEIGTDFSAPNGYIFNFFHISSAVCEQRTSGTPQLVSRTSSPYPYERMQSMRVMLMTAATSGSSVRVHWTGDYCWVDDVMLCTDATCRVMY